MDNYIMNQSLLLVSLVQKYKEDHFSTSLSILLLYPETAKVVKSQFLLLVVNSKKSLGFIKNCVHILILPLL